MAITLFVYVVFVHMLFRDGKEEAELSTDST
jgi:hypothetical protein